MELQKKYVEIAKEFAKRYEKDNNIIGITLSGGISRGTGDEYSEIDLNFYVENINDGELPPKGDINVNGVWFDFKIVNFEEEKKRKWSMVDRWDAKRSRILFERMNLLRKLFKDKVKFRPDEKNKLIKEIGFKSWWGIQLAETFEKRGDIQHAHLLLNESLNSFIDLYFIKNNEFIPYFKWKYYYFSKLKKPKPDVKKIIFDLFLIKNYSKEELYRRIELINKKIIGKNASKNFPHRQNIQKIGEFFDTFKKEIKYHQLFARASA